MTLRAPLHLLALTMLLAILGGQTAHSQPASPPAPTSARGQYGHVAERINSTVALTKTAALAADVFSNATYIPLAQKVLLPTVDLSLDGLEITQAVQTPSNSVPLVAGRSTVVRVYAKYTGTPTPGDVTVALTGTRNGVELAPVTLGPQAISASPSRAIYSSSFNLTLPAEWLSGIVELTAKVDSGDMVNESDESNNTATATLVFNSVPALDIVIVPVRYTDLPSGITYQPPIADTISDFVVRTYPLSTINVTFRPQIGFSGDLKDGQDWINLLNLIASLKITDGAPDSKVYYGLISSGNLSNTWLPSSGGFILGIGNVGSRSSAGLSLSADLGFPADLTSDTAAHEIGHNLGRKHAPCDTATGLDPNYPASDASIMEFGLDVSKGKVLDPNTAKDIMSYCDPQWISDYTYKALYNALRGNGQTTTAAAQPSLYLRASIGPDGGATLAPAYELDGRPASAPESSDYRVEFLDASGNLVASQPVAVTEIEQPHVFSRSQGRLVPQSSALAVRGMNTRTTPRAINAVVPRPAQPFASLRLMHAGSVVATRQFSQPAPAIAAARTPSITTQADGTLLLRWGDPQLPALVRYSANGVSWTTLGVDVVGGALSVDPSTLPGKGNSHDGVAGRFEITVADSVLAP
jgi:hypothetical protein